MIAPRAKDALVSGAMAAERSRTGEEARRAPRAVTYPYRRIARGRRHPGRRARSLRRSRSRLAADRLAAAPAHDRDRRRPDQLRRDRRRARRSSSSTGSAAAGRTGSRTCRGWPSSATGRSPSTCPGFGSSPMPPIGDLDPRLRELLDATSARRSASARARSSATRWAASSPPRSRSASPSGSIASSSSPRRGSAMRRCGAARSSPERGSASLTNPLLRRVDFASMKRPRAAQARVRRGHAASRADAAGAAGRVHRSGARRPGLHPRRRGADRLRPARPAARGSACRRWSSGAATTSSSPPPTPPASCERIPGAELVVFDDCGHVPMAEHPTRFNRLLARFCETDQPDRDSTARRQKHALRSTFLTADVQSADAALG